MQRTRKPSDRLFLTYARTFSTRLAREQVARDPELDNEYQLSEQLSLTERFAHLTPTDFAVQYRKLAPGVPSELRSYQLIFYLHHQQHGVTFYQLEQLEAEVAAQSGCPELDVTLLQALRGHMRIRAGQVGDAVQILTRELATLPTSNGSMYAEYLRCVLHRNLGLALQRLGDYKQAQQHLSNALRLARTYSFRLEFSCNFQLGSLQWAAGQYQAAIATHSNEDLRSAAREISDYNNLLHSHVSSAKCAIDAKDTDGAALELAAARELLATNPGAWPEVEGYVLLYSGELAVQQERFEEGLGQLQRAQSHFESLTPVHYPGLLDAKIAQCHFALYEQDYRTALAMVKTLLEEAERHQCLEARSRLLLLEAFLYITEDPPLRASYEDLVTRIHLIDNPAVQFRALGNLYTYSLQYLEEPDQLFLLERLRNLSETLPDQAYADLYQSYVTERYEYAIENRLARYVEQDWLYWDE